MIIAVDGPAASGKSTIARLVAKELSFDYVDTGAMYRALTWLALERKIDVSDEEALLRLSRELDLKFRWEKEKMKIFFKDVDVTEAIRSPKVDSAVSIVSKVPAVRKAMVKKQRLLVKGKNAVVEGRDIGTVVFPDAELKIYLTASVKERSKRRKKELQKKGHNVSLETLEREIVLRDKIDSTRSVAPLSRAPDAYLIDTTGKTIEEVKGEVINLYQKIAACEEK